MSKESYERLGNGELEEIFKQLPSCVKTRYQTPAALKMFARLFCFEQVMALKNVLSATTGSPGSKYEHRRASALLRNIQNIRICMGKKPIVSVTYENERISIKNSLPYLKCVLRLSCVVYGPIYGRFMGFYVNGFLSREKTVYI